MIGSAGAMMAMFYLAGYSKQSGSFEQTAPRDAGAYVCLSSSVRAAARIANYRLDRYHHGLLLCHLLRDVLERHSVDLLVSPIFSTQSILLTNIFFKKRRGLSNCHPLCLSCIYDVHAMARTVHHRLLDTVHGSQHHIWHLHFLWRLDRHWGHLCLVVCARN